MESRIIRGMRYLLESNELVPDRICYVAGPMTESHGLLLQVLYTSMYIAAKSIFMR